MAYYSKVSAHPTRDQKRRQAEKRGGFDDEGSNYASAKKGKRTDKRSGDTTEKRSYSKDGYRSGNKTEQRGGNRFEQRDGNKFEQRSGNKFEQRSGNKFEQRSDTRSKAPRGKRTDNNEFRFAPRGTSTYRTRGESITPKPYGEQRLKQTERMPEYNAYRAEPQQEEPMNENLLSGRNPIREALKSGRDIEKLLVAKGELTGSAKEILAMAKEQRVPIQEVDRVRLDAITPHHQGMLAFASAYQYHTVDEMLALAKSRNEQPFLVILDGVTDPHNLGAVIRTAECAGAHGVIVQERRAVGLTPAAVKASAGAIEHIMVARVVNLTATLDMLQKQGIWAYAADAEGEDYTTVDFSGGAVIVIGAEGEGISRLVLEKCDKTVALPIRGKIDSLNASVAAGILLYAVLRSR